MAITSLPVDTSESAGKSTFSVSGSVVAQNLSFAYPTRADQLILKNVTLSIDSGECVAFVG